MSALDSQEPNCEIFLVRHAESEWNASGLWQGHADPPLSEKGRGQLSALVTKLSEVLTSQRPTRIVCSDLIRARQTAEALGAGFGLSVQSDRGLRELDVGDWSGLRREEIEARSPEILARFEAGDSDARPPGGETRKEIRHRARFALRRIVNADAWGRILVVSHLGLIRALLPGAELGNAEFLQVAAADALTRRQRSEVAESEVGAGPL